MDNDKRDNQRVPVALRIKLRYRKIDTFVSKFATNISSGGMFISSRSPKSPGTELRFELRLADDTKVITGRGIVRWIRSSNPERPKEAQGMGIEFLSLAQESQKLVDRIVEQRRKQGLGVSSTIPYTASSDSAPVAAQENAPKKEQAIAESGRKTAVPRPRRRSPADTDSFSDLDSAKVDMKRALARARAMLGDDDQDQQLAELFRVSAAPVATTVDDASSKLAAILGGAPVRPRQARPESAKLSAEVPRGEAPSNPFIATEAQTEVDAPDAKVPLAVGDALEDSSDSELPPPIAAPSPAAPVALQAEHDEAFDASRFDEQGADEVETVAIADDDSDIHEIAIEADNPDDVASAIEFDHSDDEGAVPQVIHDRDLISDAERAELLEAEEQKNAAAASSAAVPVPIAEKSAGIMLELLEDDPGASNDFDEALDTALSTLDNLLSMPGPEMEAELDADSLPVIENTAVAEALSEEVSEGRTPVPHPVEIEITGSELLEEVDAVTNLGPDGLDVDAMAPDDLDGISDLSRPGGGPMDLAALAELPELGIENSVQTEDELESDVDSLLGSLELDASEDVEDPDSQETDHSSEETRDMSIEVEAADGEGDAKKGLLRRFFRKS